VSRRITVRISSVVGGLALAATFAPASAMTPEPAAPAAIASVDAGGLTTVTLDLVGDTWVSSSGETSSQSDSPELRVGSSSFGQPRSRSYLDFDYAPLADIPAGAVVTAATLSLSNFETGSCSDNPIRAARITGAWSVPALTWASQPAATTAGWATSSVAFGATDCPGEGPVTFDAKKIVSAWISGEPERGILIKCDHEASATSFRKYRSAENGDATKAPTLTVSYDSSPDTPSSLTVTPGSTGFVSSLTPTLSAVVTDSDGPVHGTFEVRKGSTLRSPLVWSASTDPVDSGDIVSVTVPEGVLVDATIYTVIAWGDDGTLRSQLPAATQFKTDLTAPTAVVTSNVFTDGAWKTTMPTSATITLNGSSDTGGFHLTSDGVEYTVGANSLGDKAVTIKPTPGWHTVVATPVDRAGNVGEPVTFSWGTGAPEFTTPAFWQQSTGDFAVDISAPAGATGATLSWLVPGESTWHTATQLVRDDSAWDGSVTADRGRSTTGAMTWHATAEAFGSGTLKAPALVLIHGCFQYDGAADKCTADRYVQLVEE
jgi:hypothetical protein